MMRPRPPASAGSACLPAGRRLPPPGGASAPAPRNPSGRYWWGSIQKYGDETGIYGENIPILAKNFLCFTPRAGIDPGKIFCGAGASARLGRPLAAAAHAVGRAFWVLAAALGASLGAGGAEREVEAGAGRVLPGYAFEFPRDHFAHPSFDSEWWYYTGNLSTAAGRHFGFELTFFRRARTRAGAGTEAEAGTEANARTEAGAAAASEPSAWDLDQVWLAHFTVTDTFEERFLVAERVNRSGPGLAGADAGQRRIWNGNWSVEWRPGGAGRPIQTLTATHPDAALRLTLEPRKPVVVHGRDGVSRKVAGDPRAVSHYLSFTRLAAAGTIALAGEELAVSGLAWMDHEFFSDYPMEDKVGWDWMSIQLDDGTDLMLFGLRDAAGRHGPDVTGTLVDPDGGARRVRWGGAALRPGRRWRSGATGAEYPVEWRVAVPDLDLRLDLRPRIDGQEVFAERGLLPPYWEGAILVSGEREGRPAAGVGYLEMTGYAERLDLRGVEAGSRTGSDPDRSGTPGGVSPGGTAFPPASGP